VSRKGVSDLLVGSGDSEKINDDALDKGRPRGATGSSGCDADAGSRHCAKRIDVRVDLATP